MDLLLSRGYGVRVLDNFESGSRDNLESATGDLEVIEGSIEDPDVLSRCASGAKYVFHLAARGSVPRSVSDPVGTHRINATGTLNVLLAARDAGVERVVCASSSSVYGETPVLPKEESMPPEPQSPYALSKLMLEQYCRLFGRLYDLETVSLRYFNVYGPRQNPNLQYAAVVPIFMRRTLRGQVCTIFGDGEQTRDFTYVRDCVEATCQAAITPGIHGEVLNVAGGNQTTVNDLLRTIQKTAGSETPPRYESARQGDVRHSCGSPEKASRQLGFRVRFTLQEGIKKTLDWYRQRV